MQVRQTRLVDFLGEPDVQLVMPVYQRVYSWTRPQLRALWEDVMEAGRLDRPHFMGMASSRRNGRIMRASGSST